MKTIKIKKVEMSYFISTGEKVEHEFIDGVVFIQGDNRTKGQLEQKNGVGKSVIFMNSIEFALYGVVSRDKFKQSDIPFNKGGKKKCVTSIDLEVVENNETTEVKIIRTINPSKLTLIVNGEDLSQSHSKSTQEYIIDNILGGIKHEIFKQSIAMDINQTNTFLTMGKVEREKFIGGIFDLSYIKEAEKLAREDFNELKKDTEVLKGKIETINNFIEKDKEKLKGYEQSVKDDVEKYKKAIEALLGEKKKTTEPVKPETRDWTKELSEKDDSIKTLRDKLDFVNGKKNDAKLEEQKIINEIKEILAENKRLKESKFCPTCNREFDESTISTIDARIDENLNLVSTKQEELKELKKRLVKINSAYSEVEKVIEKREQEKKEIVLEAESEKLKIKEYEQLKEEYDLFDKKIDRLRTEIARLEDSEVIKETKLSIEDNTKELETKKKTYDQNIKDLEVLNYVKTMFGENGIRKIVLSRIISLFNTTLSLYLKRLEAPCVLEFDSTFDYKMTTLGGIEIPYGSLSGGEKFRLTTALAFTFKDVLRIQNQIAFDIAEYDEWFDVSVDSRGLQIISEILTERWEKYGERQYVITHREDLIVDNSTTITVIKENGISRIED